ncbi:sigma-54 interaction domain-containing protein [Anaeromicrobium sediminis]|uniref:Sigma-54 factor interaction domain-containing protein n=1 Tax=Anaeromicrobium sediminis TaxID=1478221 RepID=A0A267MHY6_9FIRM|nr:sigma 54-interacting transcriptional regulator [Anaeromicrobium sediminis]PAB58485.1 hypothetical protein CCE28_15380 [Anaeromicrobium sediminis]
MLAVEVFSDDLNKILKNLCHIVNVDGAIFDKESKLVTCTESYLEHKGQTVHAPFIEEVMSKGKILVNNPGSMKPCIGCRFKENCPSTIELLNCIKIDDIPIGVISLTAFTKDGHNKIIKNLSKYIDLLNAISLLISKFLAQNYHYKGSLKLDKLFKSGLDLSDEPLLISDTVGSIQYYNSSALKLFKVCDHYKQSIHNLFPEKVVNKILNQLPLLNESMFFDNTLWQMSSTPVNDNYQPLGSIIKLTNKYKDLNIHDKNNDTLFIDNIVGESNEIHKLKGKIRKIANSSSTTLITGETGTGKGLLAKTIHKMSNRADFPFVAINCASIPDTLFESELFGYEEGAFTGAKKGGKVGKFELAQGGTLFLDEVGEMPLHMQAKLLRVLQDYEIERVGGITSTQIDVRVIAATNQHIEKLIEEKKFRADLYYRLNIIPINIPSLKVRLEDITLLSMKFIDKYSLKLNRHIDSISDEVLSVFKSYHWPGNVRELENTIEYAVNMCDSSIINVNDLPDKFMEHEKYKRDEMKSKVKKLELETIRNTLNKHGWDVKGKTAAADELGIGLRTLYRKIKDLQNV